VGSKAGLDTEARGKILFLYRASNPDRPVVQSAVRHYTDGATPTLFYYIIRVLLSNYNSYAAFLHFSTKYCYIYEVSLDTQQYLTA
jgi:hypothetical protein